MRLFYLTYQEDALLYAGVKKKIQWQARAFEKLGYDVTYSMWQDNQFCFYQKGEVSKVELPVSGRRMKQFFLAAETYLKTNQIDTLYIRLDRVTYDVPKICRIARENGTKTIVVELPNYPYIHDYLHGARGVKPLSKKLITQAKILWSAVEDRLSGRQLKGLVDAAALIGNPDSDFFGVPAIHISNGVDVDSIIPVPQKDTPEKMVLISVAGTLWWQAYDRLMKGMQAYKTQKSPDAPDVKFIMVGGDAKEMPGFRKMIQEYGLTDDVECPGFQTGEALDEYYKRADAGVSTLGCYLRGLKSCSSLKTKEFCAKGLPFIYTLEDSIEQEKPPFALQFSNDPTPIDVGKVVEFIARCRENSELPEEEREFARAHFDWTSILKSVLDFAERQKCG